MNKSTEDELLSKLTASIGAGLKSLLPANFNSLGDANAAIRGVIRKAINDGKHGAGSLIGKVLNGFNHREWENSVLNDVIPTLNKYYK